MPTIPGARRVPAVLLACLSTLLLAGCGEPGTPSATTAAPSSPAVDTPPATTPPPTTSPPTAPTSTTPPSTTSPSTTPPPIRTTPPATTRSGLPGSLLGQDFERIPTSARVIALTFDAGANADSVASILATLQSKGVVGTFFLTGDFVTEFPAPSRQIAAAGHRLGNHTVDHPHLPSLSDEQVRAQILGAQESIQEVTGADPTPWFRFPYGDRDTRTIGLVNDLGYVPIRWTVDSLGWQGTVGGTRGPAFVRDRVVNAARAGGIVLMHVGSNPDDHSTLDADALPGIIDELRAQGYSFVTLDALLH